MYSLRAILENDLENIRLFTDREIGAGYYSAKEVADIFKRSINNGITCSFLLEDESQQIKGIRLSFPPRQWQSGKGRGLQPRTWPHAIEDTAYFQSIFLASDVQGKGWGAKLSQAALKALRQTGALGIVCHSWKESPNDSSGRYLRKLGFALITEYADYWHDVPYNCSRCGKPPCKCTAQEMYLNLEKNP
jgi:GNAT superfamily N-acetyltransferase